jgi:hypothetical protein
MGRAIKVYLLDDVAAMRLVLRTVLELEGMTVVFSGYPRSQMAEPALSLKAARYVEKGEPLERVVEAVQDLAA